MWYAGCGVVHGRVPAGRRAHLWQHSLVNLPTCLPQVLAARKLHAYCRHCGRPVEAAIAAAGGTHMLLIMLDSLDRSLKDVCTRLLTDLAADDRVR